MSYRAIIFDFFDVIRSDPLNGWLREHGLQREGAVHAASVELDSGNIDVAEFLGRLGTATGQTAAEVEEEFGRHTAVNDELVSLIGELAKHYDIGLLSNAESAFIRAILAEHDLERLFHHIVISSEVGMVKPAPEIFRHMLERLKVSPEQAIFIDDNIKNTGASEQVGIRAVQYVDMPTLRADLNGLGVKLP